MNRQVLLEDDIRLSITYIKIQQLGLEIKLLSYQLRVVNKGELIGTVRNTIQKITDEIVQINPRNKTMESFATKLLALLQGQKSIELREDELVALIEITQLSAKLETLELLKHSGPTDLSREIEETRTSLHKIIKEKKILEVFNNHTFYPALFYLNS